MKNPLIHRRDVEVAEIFQGKLCSLRHCGEKTGFFSGLFGELLGLHERLGWRD